MDLKSKHSYQTQSFLWLLGFSWLLIVCFVGFQYHREKELRTELLDSQLQIINAQLEEALSNARTPHDFFDAHSDFFEGLRITLIDLDGTVVYDSEEPPAEMSNHLDRPEVAAALTDGHGYTIRRQSENNGRTYFYSASRIGDRIVRSSLPYTVSLSQVLNADRNFLWFMGSVTLLLCLVGYYVVRQFTKNMVQMEATLAERDREHAAALHEEQEKIRIKRQLTNNINHELKTPVSSIHGYLETLIANPHIDAATQRAFLEKCFTQSERLRQLLQDVSSIIRLDEGGQMIDRTEVDLRALIGEVITDTAPESARRGFTVHWTCDRPPDGRGQRRIALLRFPQPDGQRPQLLGRQPDRHRPDGRNGRPLRIFILGQRHGRQSRTPALPLRTFLPDRQGAFAPGGRHRTRPGDRTQRHTFPRRPNRSGEPPGRGTRVPVLDRQEGGGEEIAVPLRNPLQAVSTHKGPVPARIQALKLCRAELPKAPPEKTA